MKFFAEGTAVFMDRGGHTSQICTVNPAMLTPKILAQEIAEAMNAKFSNK